MNNCPRDGRKVEGEASHTLELAYWLLEVHNLGIWLQPDEVYAYLSTVEACEECDCT